MITQEVRTKCIPRVASTEYQRWERRMYSVPNARSNGDCAGSRSNGFRLISDITYLPPHSPRGSSVNAEENTLTVVGALEKKD